MDAKDKSVKIKHLKNRDYIKYDRGYKIPMRIFEIVGDDPTAQSSARERYKQYRTQGFELNTHKIGK